MSLVNLFVLIALSSNFRLWMAMILYLLWVWVGEPLFAKLVGATQGELAAQEAQRVAARNAKSE